MLTSGLRKLNKSMGLIKNSEGSAVLSTRFRLLLVILGLLGAGIILFSTNRYGAGLSPDSVGYIATARSIAHGAGVVNFDGAPLVLQPPLYPAILAAFESLLRIDPLLSVRFVNACLFGLIIYFSGLLLFKHLPSSVPIVFMGTVFILAAFPLIQVSLMAWTEPLFVFFILQFLIYIESYRVKKDTTSLLLLSFTVALASLTRYVGVILIPTAIISMLFFRRDKQKINFRHLVLFSFISGLPVFLWMVRNYLFSGTLMGPRAPSSISLDQNLIFVYKTYLSWYVTKKTTDHRTILMLMTIVIGILAVVGFTRSWVKERIVCLRILPVLLLIVIYVTFLVISSTTTAYDSISNRLLIPVFVPSTLLLLIFLDHLSKPLARYFSPRLMNLILSTCIFVLLIYPAGESISLISNVIDQGLGYNNKSWKNHETIQHLLHHPIPKSTCGTYYSNAPDALYILVNLTAKMSPAKTEYNSPKIANKISEINGSWPKENRSCLVWFDPNTRKYLFNLEELQYAANLEQVVRLQDGSLYTVSRK